MQARHCVRAGVRACHRCRPLRKDECLWPNPSTLVCVRPFANGFYDSVARVWVLSLHSNGLHRSDVRTDQRHLQMLGRSDSRGHKIHDEHEWVNHAGVVCNDDGRLRWTRRLAFGRNPDVAAAQKHQSHRDAQNQLHSHSPCPTEWLALQLVLSSPEKHYFQQNCSNCKDNDDEDDSNERHRSHEHVLHSLHSRRARRARVGERVDRL